MKWYRNHRPKVHFWFWNVLLLLNMANAGFMAWAQTKVEMSLTKDIVISCSIAAFCFFMTRIWLHWIDNPEDYETLQKARDRRLGARVGRSRGKGKKRKEKKED